MCSGILQFACTAGVCALSNVVVHNKLILALKLAKVEGGGMNPILVGNLIMLLKTDRIF